MLRYEMADQIEEEIDGSDDGDLSSDDESEVRESDNEKDDSDDNSKARLGDNDEESKDGVNSSQQDSEAYADMEDLDPFGQFDGVENDEDMGALFGVQSDTKMVKKGSDAKPFGNKMEDEDFM